ncbi:MAG: hypothetical protein ACT4OI_06000, partial [Methanobacteriota archaeon]
GVARVRAQSVYGRIGLTALLLALAAAVLALVGLAIGQMQGAAAAAVCTAAFFVPGLVLFNYARRLRLRDVALAHVVEFVKAHGAIDADGLATELSVPRGDADKILRRAVAEGRLRGAFDDQGRFVSEGTLRCGRCGTPLPTADACPSCGAAIAR